ncbi:MAG: hypothetical protein EOO45_10425 [Flavobacterium sp.]|nr:MAG: hypothetical protein EOO45_10425 [Flavobacterium sp.]
MKLGFYVILLLCLSCKKQPEEISIASKFVEIPYDVKDNYLDSLPKKIIPNKPLKYWQYATYSERLSTDKKIYTILSQGGDTALRKMINTKIDPIKITGLFEGGHPGFRANYLIVIEKDKVEYIDSMEGLRDFIGSIDNLEEAILFAKSYGYVMGSKLTGRMYKFSNGTYTFHLVKYSDSYPESMFRLKAELIELTITADAYIKSKSIGIYCKEEDCFRF